MFDSVVDLCRFAYIEFADKESVRTAMALDESLFRGRQIKVRPVPLCSGLLQLRAFFFFFFPKFTVTPPPHPHTLFPLGGR